MQTNNNVFQNKQLSPECAGKIAWRMFCTPQNSRQPRSAREQKLADNAEQFYLETEKIKLAYYRWKPISGHQNPLGNKRVLLIHGWNCHALSFVALTQSLLEQGFEVVAFDGPAHGASSGERTNLIEFARSAQAVIEAIGGVHTLIGHSLGAMTLAYMMSGHSLFPQDGNLQRLVMIGTPESLSDLVDNFVRAMKIPAPILAGMNIEFKRLFGRSIQWYSTSDFVHKINIPILLIHDFEDQETPLIGAKKIAAAAPNAKLIVTENLGHHLIMRSPKVIKEILAFVQYDGSLR